MALRTLYLQSMLSVNGRNALSGRVLYDRLRQISEETILGHLVYSDEAAEKIKNPLLKPDVISSSLLQEFRPNVVFVEGGLFASADGSWKLPENMATEFCQSGGVLIVADVDVNEFHHKKAHYWNAGNIFRAFAKYGDHDDPHPVYGADRSRFWKGGRQILCDPKKMLISEWVRPIYDGVPEILVGLPVRLARWESLVASCNNDTTGTLHEDIWEDQIDPCPFAAAAQIGSGFAVLIAGQVSDDVWLQGCTHNTRWLTNLAAFLVSAAEADLVRRRSHRRSPHLLFLSHRSTDKQTISVIANAIKDRGVNVWFDAEQLIPSQSLTAEISQALGKMTAFVLFWSSNCVGAPWVERELNSAVALLVEGAVPLIIVRLDDTPVPTIVADIFRIEALGEAAEHTGARIVNAITRLHPNAG
jgi:TIR domain